MIATTIDMVRDLLLGADQNTFDDAYIQRQIDYGMNAVDIAIMVAESQASIYASKANMRAEGLSIDKSKQADTWMAIKKNLLLRKATGAGLPPDGSNRGTAVGFAGGKVTGSSKSEMEALTANKDRTPNQFELGQFDNPPSNPAAAGGDTYDRG